MIWFPGCIGSVLFPCGRCKAWSDELVGLWGNPPLEVVVSIHDPAMLTCTSSGGSAFSDWVMASRAEKLTVNLELERPSRH
jgi:hypothetical protein